MLWCTSVTDNYSESVLPFNKLTFLMMFMSLVFTTHSKLQAQDSSEYSWNGEWIADGTLFKVRVDAENTVMTVSQIESMGFVWSSKDGKIAGKVATVEIEYAGVIGTVQAELINDETAIVFASKCKPDYMVVCLLTKDQRAIFKKVIAPN